MKWSLRLGSLLGIPIYLHYGFLLLLGVITLSYTVQGGPAAGLAGAVFVSAIFACVVLHEFGHALMARHFGIRTRDVTLLPIGGLARLERMPEDPRQELWVALAGPGVNVAIAGLLGIWLTVTGVDVGGLASRLLAINLGLVVFNMLPAFPMDGGRVLRALLAQRTGHVRATEVAATIGRGMAVLFGIAGLFLNPMLILIAMFVWFGAGQEAEMARQRAAFGGPSPLGSFDAWLDPRDPTGWRIFDPPPRTRQRVYRLGPWLVVCDEQRR